MTTKPKWSDVKAALVALDARALIAVINDLHDADPAARRFLHARFGGSTASIEDYRRRIVAAVYPDPLSRKPIRLRDAAALVTEYGRSTRDPAGTVDLMLTFVEAGTAQAADLAMSGMSYYSPLVRMLDQIAKIYGELEPPVRRRALERLIAIDRLADGIGWGFGDCVRAVVAEVVEQEE